ncbi:MAG: serine/threonine protein kinase [Bacteroidales bacterium]|nr:serine/threonine protein kinase [Bacteroidales bacterium]
MAVNETSTSGEITSSFENISDVFTSYSEIPSEGFNRLFKAQRYGKWYVLKGLKPEFQHKEVYARLLTKEFELGVQMDHPNIARTFSKETDPVAGPCIVMEYVDGCTLKAFLEQRPSRKMRMKVVRELLAAMSYYHSKQIIHRDLKPDNILVTHNGHNVKIIDFGLADTDYHGIFKQPAGSNKYASPEQVAGNVPLDCRADLYAFGVILRQIFPHSYGHIVRKCTRLDREKRFANAEEILQQLQRSQRLNLAMALLAVMLVLVVGALLLWPTANEVRPEPVSLETEEIAPSVSPSENIEEQQAVQAATLPQTEQGNTITPTSQVEQNRQTTQEKEVDVFSEEYLYRHIPSEAKRQIEQAVDTLFRQFWDWERAASARGVSSKDKFAEYSQSDFFKNNYEIRERHREVVVNEILRRYPQCEANREQIVTFYNSTFVKKMVAVNNVVNAWQRNSR